MKQSTMELCQKEQLNQVDLLSPSKVRITDREYWAQRRGQAALDQENKEKIEQGVQPDTTVFETQNEILRQQILAVISDSNSYEEFRKKLLEPYGNRSNRIKRKDWIFASGSEEANPGKAAGNAL